MKTSRRRAIPSIVAALMACLSLATYVHAAPYETLSGAKPDVQSKQIVDQQTLSINEFTKICRDGSVEGGRYAQISSILADELDEAFGVTLAQASLSAQSDKFNQIIIGDPSQPVVADLATALKRSTTDLGEEGYNLVARPNPASTNGSWIILIVANTSKGVLNGAYSLVDLLSNAAGNVENLRIRDYPDYEMRWLMHRPQQMDTNAIGEWVDSLVVDFQEIAGRGVSALGIGVSEFWNLQDPAVLAGMAEAAYWARYYGMELMPAIGSPRESGPNTDPLWREGAFIRDEPFVVTESLVLEPVIPPLDNHELGLDFDLDDGGSPPFAKGWERTNGGNPVRWEYVHVPGGDGYVSLNGTPSAPGTGISTLTGLNATLSELQPGSFYVLEVRYDHVISGSVHLLVQGTFTNSEGELETNSFRDEIIEIKAGGQAQDYYFWTPPSAAQVANDPHYQDYPVETLPLFEDYDANKFRIAFSADPGFATDIQVNELFLERRNSSLRNVMITEDGVEDLTLTVTSLDGQTVYGPGGADYALNLADLIGYHMPTRKWDPTTWTVTQEALSTLTWSAEQPGAVGTQVLVSYTLGVPDDWNVGQQARTWCLRSPGYRDAVFNRLRQFYVSVQIDPHDTGISFPYAFNPKSIGVGLSEFRGANRCGRDVDAGLSNGMYFADYVSSTVVGILDEIAVEYPAAQATDITAGGNFSPGVLPPAEPEGDPRLSPGEEDDYQFNYGGPYGDSAFRQSELALFGSTSRRVIFGISNGNCFSPYDPNTCNAWEYAARDLHWPYAFGAPSNVFIVAVNNLDVCTSVEHTTSGDGVAAYDASTWLLPDCLGFSAVDRDYDRYHDKDELRLMDYGWRRYSKPEATLQARLNGNYVTDDEQGATINISQPTIYTFLPFGGREMRDPVGPYRILSEATMDWGFGDPPVDVLSELNAGTVTQTYWRNTHTAVLSITSEFPGGAQPLTKTASITFVGPQDPPPPPPTGKTTEPAPFGIRSGGLNPFRAQTRIDFGLPRAGEVQLEVYDLRGRRVVSLARQAAYAAGVHSVEWNGRDDRGQTVASGTYILQLKAVGQTATQKLLLIK